MNLSAIFGILFFVTCCLHLAAASCRWTRVTTATKPLLIPLLLVAYLLATENPQWQIAAALGCGFAGDCFLLFPKRKICFITGLFCFLGGHLFYITLFLSEVRFRAVPPAFYLLALVWIWYGIFVYRSLSDTLGAMRIPCIFYLLCILAMSFSSLLRFSCAGGWAFWLPFIGSLCFIASDTMLADQCFRPSSKNLDPQIMATYLIAQTYIVIGSLL